MFLRLLKEALRLTPVFLFGSAGETLTEKGGHLNLGTPGVICIGAAGGMVGVTVFDAIYGSLGLTGFPLVFLLYLHTILFALLFGTISGVIFSFFTVSLRCNQNVMGLAFTTFGIGFYGLIFVALGKDIFFYNTYCSAINTLFVKDIDADNWFALLFGANGLLWYLSFIFAICIAIVMRKTRAGLIVETVGENAGCADAAGINVGKTRYLSTMLGSAISALGGLYYFIEINIGLVEFGTVDAYGWLAVALVIFTLWKTDLGILGAFLFAFLFKLPEIYSLPSAQLNMLFTYLPYFVTIVILVMISIFDKKGTQAPSNLGIPYFREER